MGYFVELLLCQPSSKFQLCNIPLTSVYFLWRLHYKSLFRYDPCLVQQRPTSHHFYELLLNHPPITPAIMSAQGQNNNEDYLDKGT
jgi:hypothetical protein